MKNKNNPGTPCHASGAPLLAFLLALIAVPVGGEPMRGPLPAKQRAIIQELAERHDELQRQVTLREDGYTATTTSDIPALASKLVEHVNYMKKRLDSGAMVRRWDPAFAEMVAYHHQLNAEIEVLDNGVRVVVTGKTPEAISVAHNHARIVTGFTERGAEAVGEPHETALGESN